MKRQMIAALMLAASAGRAPVKTHRAEHRRHPQSFALWVTDKSHPDEAPCAGRLRLAARHIGDEGETRVFSTTDGRFAVIIDIPHEGSVTAALRVSGAAGVGSGMVSLSSGEEMLTRGFGADGVSVFDSDARMTKMLGNVTLLPVVAAS